MGEGEESNTESCVFCQIVSATAPGYIFWRDERHLAFLSIYPNTLGVTVVVPKKHCGSYAFDQPDETLAELVLAAKKVARILDATLQGVGRTALVFEGYGVDHLHAKLFPLHATGGGSDFRKISSRVDKYFHHYEGYVSSHDWQRADDHELRLLAAELAAQGLLMDGELSGTAT